MAKDYTKATWIDEVLGGGGTPLYDIDGGSIGNDVTIEQVETVSVAGTELNAAKMNNIETGIDDIDTFLKEAASEITVSSGGITVTKSRHSVQPESGTSDTIDTISGMDADTFLILYVSDEGTDTLTLEHGTGNLDCPHGQDFDFSNGLLLLYYDGTTVYLMATQKYSIQAMYTAGGNAPVPGSSTRYLGFYDLPTGFISNIYNLSILRDCVITNLSITSNSTQPATGDLVADVLVDVTDTALSVTFAAGQTTTTLTDTSRYALTAGQAVTLRFVNSDPAASAKITRCSAELLFPLTS